MTERSLTPDSLLTIPEAHAELRISERHLFRLMAGGRIRRVKLGSRTLIPYREVLRYGGAVLGLLGHAEPQRGRSIGMHLRVLQPIRRAVDAVAGCEEAAAGRAGHRGAQGAHG